MFENYSKTIHIEALTMIDMIKKSVIPATIGYQNELVTLVSGKKSLGITDTLEADLLDRISKLSNSKYLKLHSLEDEVVESGTITDEKELAAFNRDKVFASMQELRGIVDELETIISEDYWTLPTYGEMLYSIL